MKKVIKYGFIISVAILAYLNTNIRINSSGENANLSIVTQVNLAQAESTPYYACREDESAWCHLDGQWFYGYYPIW